MIKLRKSKDRGHFDLGWLDTYHSFSFDRYHDPRFMGFRSLRVINEDRVQPGEGFPTHGHSDMEIITYVLEGALEHKDSMGTGSVIRPGDVQKMSAGTGVRHSEYNGSKAEFVHLLQIWIIPDTMGIKPDYQQKRFEDEEKRGRLRLIVSPDGDEGSVTISQDARVYATLLAPSQQVVHHLEPNRHAWVQAARGAIELNGHHLFQGDGAAVSAESKLTMTGRDAAEILLFDLA
ncbi:MAG: quercetin 2,3-dioxygenase [Acidobacteriota bacterium]|jgi:redox-sensitive bicupin YhaK (pirin superfamily)|nr:quercetin 2,3-dioxygenase [Acidobacteriota bacterium]